MVEKLVQMRRNSGCNRNYRNTCVVCGELSYWIQRSVFLRREGNFRHQSCRSGETSSRWKGGRKSLLCVICGVESKEKFYPWEYAKKIGAYSCSSKCAIIRRGGVWNKGLRKECSESVKKISDKLVGRKLPETVRLKIRNTCRSDEFRNGRCERLKSEERKITSAEKKMMDILNGLDVEYEYQSVVRGFLCDFFIPSRKIIIEADGDYWHGNPEKFHVLDDTQKRHAEIRERKRRIIGSLGIRLLEVYESDMNKQETIEFIRRETNGN